MSYDLKDYLNSINSTKENLMEGDDEMWEKKYPAFIVNKCLSPFTDTIMFVNEMNIRSHIDNKMQYDFFINILRSRKRYSPWMKKDKDKNLDLVKEYYGYSNEKALSALSILNQDQLSYIKQKLYKGGKSNDRRKNGGDA
jgi:hypothetical protein